MLYIKGHKAIWVEKLYYRGFNFYLLINTNKHLFCFSGSILAADFATKPKWFATSRTWKPEMLPTTKRFYAHFISCRISTSTRTTRRSSLHFSDESGNQIRIASYDVYERLKQFLIFLFFNFFYLSISVFQSLIDYFFHLNCPSNIKCIFNLNLITNSSPSPPFQKNVHYN